MQTNQTRRRLPGLHMGTQEDAHVPLRDALASFLWFQAHNWGIVGGGLDGVHERWSYLSDDEALPYYMMAGAAIETTQRWIAHGIETPKDIPLGPLVERPSWALRYFSTAEHEDLSCESIEEVGELRLEIETEEVQP